MSENNRAVIVTGPQGSGKSRAAQALLRHFRLHCLVEEWEPGQPVVPCALHLTHEPLQAHPDADVWQWDGKGGLRQPIAH